MRIVTVTIHWVNVSSMRATYLTRQTESVLLTRPEKPRILCSFENHVVTFSPILTVYWGFCAVRFAAMLLHIRKQWKAVGEISNFFTEITGTLRQPDDCTWKDAITHPSRTSACNNQQERLTPLLRIAEAASLPGIPGIFVLSRTKDLN